MRPLRSELLHWARTHPTDALSIVERLDAYIGDVDWTDRVESALEQASRPGHLSADTCPVSGHLSG